MGATGSAVHVEAMPRPPSDTIQITARVPSAWPAEFDELAAALSRSRPGLTITRTDAYRIALARGLQELQRELGLDGPKSHAEAVRANRDAALAATKTKKPGR